MAAASANDASFVLTQAITKLNRSLQRGSYCSKAGSNFHVLLKAGISLLNEANKIAQEQASSDPVPYWQRDAHRFSPFD